VVFFVVEKCAKSKSQEVNKKCKKIFTLAHSSLSSPLWLPGSWVGRRFFRCIFEVIANVGKREKYNSVNASKKLVFQRF
jgi:hypothetical protein